MRIGILGGTFDPVHLGHLYLAKEVLNKLSLKKVIFIPTYLPPHKKNIKITKAADRYKMVKLAILNNKRLELSDIEIKRKGRSYLVETMLELRRKYRASTEIFFITGSDSLKDLDKWKDTERVFELCKFVVVKRPHFTIQNASPVFIVLHIDAKDISSSDIRRRIRDGQPVEELLPKKVRAYIEKHGLYAGNV